MTRGTSTGRATRTSRRPVGASPAPRPAPPGGGQGGTTPAPGRGRRWVLLVVGVVVGVQLGLLAGFVLPGAGDDEPAAPDEAAVVGADGPPLDPDDPLAERVAELQAEEAARDAEAVVVLTEQTEEVLAVLSPVITGAGEHAPGTDPPTPETVEQWRSAVARAEQTFGDAPSGGTDVNVARAALVASLGTLETMVAAFDLVADPAGSAPVDGAGPVDVDATLEVAASARRSAALAWSVGATQLDAVNVAADRGHVHLYLPPVDGSGALTADPEPVSP